MDNILNSKIKNDLDIFMDNAIDEMQKIRETCTMQFYSDAAKLILEAEEKGKRLHISGIGKPHHIGGYCASLLSSTGTPCYFLDGTEATHGSAGQVLSGDVVICISYYGNVPELKKTVATLKNNGAKIISITGFEESWIAKQSDVHLLAYIDKEGDYLNKPPRTSMLATMLVFMGLSICLQSVKNITPEQYVKWHPSGQLGLLDD
jgi:D-arabinose 5-phosphate isomerase GutQ